MNPRITYSAVVVGNTIRRSKTKQTPSINICCAVEQADGSRKFYYGDLFLTFASIEKTIKTLQKTFNWKGKNIAEFNEPILKDLTCDIVVEHDPKYDSDKIVFFNKSYSMEKLNIDELEGVVSEVQEMVDKIISSSNQEISVVDNNQLQQRNQGYDNRSVPVNTQYEDQDMHF